MRYRFLSTRRAVRLLTLLLVLLLAVTGSVIAQGGLIGYGQSISGALTAQAPFALYTFNGAAGDHVTAYVAGLTDAMQPGLSLLGPDQRQLAISSGDALLGQDSSLARVTYRLQQTGLHTLLITNIQSVPGEYVLHLSARPSTASQALPANAPVTFNIPPGAAPIHYSFAAALDAPRTLLISSDTPGFAFSAQLFDGLGRPVAQLGGSTLQGVSLIIGPDSGTYEIAVAALLQETQGMITLLLSTGGAPETVATPVPANVEPTQPPGCRVVTAGNTRVNVRSGPATVFPAIASLYPDTPVEVIGQSVDGTWYVLNNAGQRGWVAGSVTLLQGDCGILPFFESPPTPTPPPATPTPPAPPGAVIDFTVNGTGSATVFSGGCATVAWNTANVREVYYEGTGVSGVGSRNECPAGTKTYTLRVVLQDGTETTRNVAIVVSPYLVITPMLFVTLQFPPPGP